MGEVHTGLLHHSSAVSLATASRLLDVGLGERVRRSERPISYASSPPQLTGVDCPLTTTRGGRIRGVGTAASRAIITGGHVLQASAYATIVPSKATRRLPWSHYLARPGVIETVGKADRSGLATGFFQGKSSSDQLDLGAIGKRTMDTIQDRGELDHRTAFPSTRTRLRWVMAPAGETDRPVVFGVTDDVTRTITLPYRELDLVAFVELCEDLALHDWLLTTLLSLIERSRIGAGPRVAVLARLRPAFDFLLHLWMPAARVDQNLTDVWRGVELRPGFSRQWQVNVDRVRDQLALGTLERLGAGSHGS